MQVLGEYLLTKILPPLKYLLKTVLAVVPLDLQLIDLFLFILLFGLVVILITPTRNNHYCKVHIFLILHPGRLPIPKVHLPRRSKPTLSTSTHLHPTHLLL